jgi:hypothetical protein
VGFSNHNFAIAWDVGIFVNGRYLTGRNAKEEEASWPSRPLLLT